MYKGGLQCKDIFQPLNNPFPLIFTMLYNQIYFKANSFLSVYKRISRTLTFAVTSCRETSGMRAFDCYAVSCF